MNENSARKPIVVGVDGSRYSREALRWATNESVHRGTLVRALMVWHPESIVAGARPTMIGVAAPVPTEPVESFRNELRRLVDEAEHEHEGVRIDGELVEGSAPEVLVRESADAELLVLGSHGHGRLLEALLGSVARHCVRHARCPVVVIPAGLADERVRARGGEPESAVDVAGSAAYGFGPLL